MLALKPAARWHSQSEEAELKGVQAAQGPTEGEETEHAGVRIAQGPAHNREGRNTKGDRGARLAGQTEQQRRVQGAAQAAAPTKHAGGRWVARLLVPARGRSPAIQA